MASRFLPVFMSNALDENQEMLPVFIAGDVTLLQALQFCQRFRVAGIGSLLLSGTSAHLHAFLHKSARAFLHFLRCRPRSWPGSKAEPFFDAVACEDSEAARELAGLAPRAADRRLEYEEDFLYARFLMDHFFLGVSAADGVALLKRYEDVLEGSEDPRLGACRALLEGNAEEFDGALVRMMEAREARYAKMADKEVLSEEILATEGFLCVEGLALMRLARSKGLMLPEDHLFIPSVGLESVPRNYRSDDWKNVLPT